MTPYNVITPPVNIISHLKVSANNTALHSWIKENIASCSHLIMSSELYLYGGLIASRISNETETIVLDRLKELVSIKQAYPQLKIYISNVIMRIPSYNGDFEEPTYWAKYGEHLFEWSYYTDRYNQLHQETDLKWATKYRDMIPQSVRDEFIWRRKRNEFITATMLDLHAKMNLFERIYITLDDSADYGFNKQDERALRQIILEKGLTNSTYVYPGADEVGLTMLSHAAMSSQTQIKTRARVVYRVPYAKDFIPNYEGQPLSHSVVNQITAAGGVVVPDGAEYDVVVLVHNFNTTSQQEAPQHQSDADYSPLYVPILEAVRTNKPIVLADVRYSNGADLFFIKWIYNLAKDLKLGKFSYAGWNTAGNTLGTCISNGMLLSLFGSNPDAIRANQVFTVYRFLEDARYQAYVRQQLSNYVVNVAMGDTNRLDIDKELYSLYVQKGLNAELDNFIKKAYPETSALVCKDLYFPWARAFEIGFTLDNRG